MADLSDDTSPMVLPPPIPQTWPQLQRDYVCCAESLRSRRATRLTSCMAKPLGLKKTNYMQNLLNV